MGEHVNHVKAKVKVHSCNCEYFIVIIIFALANHEKVNGIKKLRKVHWEYFLMISVLIQLTLNNQRKYSLYFFSIQLILNFRHNSHLSTWFGSICILIKALRSVEISEPLVSSTIFNISVFNFQFIFLILMYNNISKIYQEYHNYLIVLNPSNDW